MSAPGVTNRAELTLADLKPGESGRVTGFTEDGDVPSRVLEMGVLPGTDVTVVRLAPLGDPIDVHVRGYHLSLRADEARLVRVIRTA